MIVSVAVIVIRIVWVFPLTYLPRFLFQHARGRHDHTPWQHPLLVGVERHARRRVAGGRACDPAPDRRGHSVSGTRPDHLHHVLRDPRDARAAGTDAALVDPPPGRRRRARARDGGEQGAAACHEGRARAPRRARERGLGAGRHRRTDARPARLPQAEVRRALRRRRRRATSRSARSTTSTCSGRCSRRSARRSRSYAARARSTTR